MQEAPRITLKAARINAGLSQTDAAREIGISRATLLNYEAGKTVPDVLTTRKIEDVYKFPVKYILFGADTT